MTYTPGKFDWKKANALNGYSGVQEAMGDFNSRLTNTINKGKGFAKNSLQNSSALKQKKDPNRPPDHRMNASLYITYTDLRFNGNFSFDHEVYDLNTKATYITGKKSYKGLPLKDSGKVSIVHTSIFIEGDWNAEKNRYEGYIRESTSAPATEDMLEYSIIDMRGVRSYSSKLLNKKNDFTTDENLTDKFIERFDKLPENYIFSSFKITFNSLTILTSAEVKQIDKLFTSIRKKLIKKFGTDKIDETSLLGPEIIVNPDFPASGTAQFIIDTDTPEVKVTGKYLEDYENAGIYTKTTKE